MGYNNVPMIMAQSSPHTIHFVEDGALNCLNVIFIDKPVFLTLALQTQIQCFASIVLCRLVVSVCKLHTTQ
jgi:hypothetical protein